MTDFNRGYKSGHTYSAFLSNKAVIWKNPAFIASQFCPEIPVDRQSDKYPVYDKERFRWENTARVDKAKFGLSTEGFTTATYATQGYGLGDHLSKKEMANMDAQLRGEMRVTDYLREKIELDREVRITTLAVADASFNTGHTVTLDAAQAWDAAPDSSESDPIAQIETAIATIKSATFMMPDTIIVPWKAAFKLARHPKVQAFREKIGDRSITDLGLLPSIMGLRVLVSQAGYSTTKKGQTLSLSNILGNYAVVCRVGTPQYGDPTWMNAFKWWEWEVETSYDPSTKSNLVTVESPEWDEKVISNLCAYRIGSLLITE